MSCGRPICVDCTRPTPAGARCRECEGRFSLLLAAEVVALSALGLVVGGGVLGLIYAVLNGRFSDNVDRYVGLEVAWGVILLAVFAAVYFSRLSRATANYRRGPAWMAIAAAAAPLVIPGRVAWFELCAAVVASVIFTWLAGRTSRGEGGHRFEPTSTIIHFASWGAIVFAIVVVISPHPPGDSSSTNSSSFCDSHNCIPSFSEGNGSIVQCADGAWSHSGGIQGACSSHGGE